MHYYKGSWIGGRPKFRLEPLFPVISISTHDRRILLNGNLCHRFDAAFAPKAEADPVQVRPCDDVSGGSAAAIVFRAWLGEMVLMRCWILDRST